MPHRNFETAFHHSAIGMALVAHGGRFMRVNPAFCRIVGYEEEELLPLSIRSLTYPEDAAESDRLVVKLWSGEIDRYELEKRYVRKDGSLVWVLLSVSAVRDDDGAISHVIAQVQDISQRRMAEEARRAGDLRYRAITDATSDIIVLTDLNGVAEYASPSVLRYGWRVDDIVGHRFMDRVHPDDRPFVEEGMRRLFQQGGLDLVRWRARRGDNGEWRWFESHASIVTNEDGGEPKILDVVRDIHEQVESAKRNADARAAAEEATQIKSEFLANISHEIRTPLTAVLGFTELLARRADLPPDAADAVDKIELAGRGLLALVNDVIDFSKLEAEQFEVRPRPTRLAQLAEDVLAMFEAAAARKSLTLSIDVNPGLRAPRDCDPDRLRQMLSNLVGNAIKFTAIGNVRLSMCADERPDWVTIEVVDTGPGISRESQVHLFKRFSQVNGARNRDHGGAGLGLAITRGMAEAMGGEITVDSMPGLGSTFRLRLPAPIVTAAPRRHKSEPLPDISGTRVLVVDDNAANRAVAEKLLEIFGVDTVTVDSGERALLVLDSEPFDVVLLDIRMPQMDGPETLYRLRDRVGPNQRTPVLAFTADVEDAERAFEDFDGYIGKPINPEGMVRSIAHVLSHAHAWPITCVG